MSAPASALAPRREVIEAGAGCGKTYGLVSRYIEGLGYDPENGAAGKLIREPRAIMALTFTEDAAEEMRHRVLDRLDHLGLGQLKAAVIEESRICTFHSLCLQLLRPHLASLGYGGGGLMPDAVARELRARHAFKELSDFEQRNKFLRYFDLRALSELAAKLWFSQAGLGQGALETLRERMEDFRRRQLGAADIALALSNAEDVPGNWLLAFKRALEAPSLAAAKGIDFTRGPARKLKKEHPSLADAAALWREFLKAGLADSLAPDALGFEIALQNEIAAFFAGLRTQGPRALDFSAIEHELHRLVQTPGREKPLMPPPRVLLVDEFQDTNRVQYEILQGLSSPETEWYFVGDPKQSIYKFRGAEVSLFHALRSELDLRELDRNFRSEPAVLEFMNLVQQGLFDATRALDPAAQPLASGRFERARGLLLEGLETPARPAVKVLESADPGHFVARLAADFRARQDELGPGSTHAALFNSWRKLYAYAAALTREGVPFRVAGSEPYLAHHLTSLFSAVLEWLHDPSSALGAVALARWREMERWQPRTPDESDLAQLRALFGADALECSWPAILHRFAAAVQPARWYRGAEWSAAMERALLELEAAGLPYSMTLADLAKFLERQADRLAPDVPGILAGEEEREVLQLYTVHGSKGLEFDAVYLPELIERSRANRDQSLENDEGAAFRLRLREAKADGEVSERPSLLYLARQRQEAREAEAESRRLFYVALTRAKRTLNLYLHSPKDPAPKPDPYTVLGLPAATPGAWHRILCELRGRGVFRALEHGGFLAWEFEEAPPKANGDDEAGPRPETPEQPETWLLPQPFLSFETIEGFHREGVSEYIQRAFADEPVTTNSSASKLAPEPAAPVRLSPAELGTEIHKVLEVWDGNEATLDALLPDAQERDTLRKAVLGVRHLPELQPLWLALAQNDAGITREFGLYIHSDRYRLSGYADLLWFREDELWIVDWKTSSSLRTLRREERKQKILLQLKLYAEPFAAHYPRIRGLAVGIEVKEGQASLILNENITS